MVNQKPVEIIRNSNGVYLLYNGPSRQAQLNVLAHIGFSIQDNPNYSEQEKARVHDTIAHDARNLWAIEKKSR